MHLSEMLKVLAPVFLYVHRFLEAVCTAGTVEHLKMTPIETQWESSKQTKEQ